MRYLNLVVFLLVVLFVCSCSSDRKRPTQAKNGILDLRGWDLENAGTVRLDGEWEFYWKQFLSSKDFDTVKKRHFINVPKPWNDYKWENSVIKNEGFATYRLRIIVNKGVHHFGLKFPDQGTAFELYINDSLVGKNGKIGKTREEMQPQYKQLLIFFQNNSDTINIVCRISNFYFVNGGLYFLPYFGGEEQIRNDRESKLRFEYFLIGNLFVLAIVLFSFFIFRPKEKSSLYFSIICLILAFRVVTTGEKLLAELVPNINWELLVRIENISGYTVLVFIVLYFKSIFKKEFANRDVILGIIYVVFFDSITLFTPAIVHSFFVIYAQVTALLFGIYIPIRVFQAIIGKREGSLIILFGFISLFVAVLNETLYYNLMIPLVFTIPMGMFVFTLSQLVLLSRKFNKAFTRIENFAAELEITVEERTKELKDSNYELEVLNQDLAEKNILISQEREKSESLLLNVLPEQIASRLKLGETTIADRFEEASVVFIDQVEFTKNSSNATPEKIVAILNKVYTEFDKIADKYGLEKIKTIGDCYMAACGIPLPRKDHARATANFALEVRDLMDGYITEEGKRIHFRTGIDCGPVVAGVIGEKKFIYDLWGDTVNTASRMEEYGEPGKIHVTERFKEKLTNDNGELRMKFEERGEIEVKGKGTMRTWFLENNKIRDTKQ